MKDNGGWSHLWLNYSAALRIISRSISIATIRGVLVGVSLTVCLLSAPAQQEPQFRRFGADSAASAGVVLADAWPICSAMGSLAESADWAKVDPDLAAAKQAMMESDWNRAITLLRSAGLRDDRNADIQNYLGFAHWKLLQLDIAVRHYQQALTLNPRHRSAHEHLGEAYLAKGNLAKAEDQLALLKQICLIPCEEFDDLNRALVKYSKVSEH